MVRERGRGQPMNDMIVRTSGLPVHLISISFIFKSDWGPDPSNARPLPASHVGVYPRTPFHIHTCSAVGAQINSLDRVISSCPDYMHADVSDGGDLSLHQQEVTGRQLVTMSLVPGTVDSNVALECCLCWPPPLTTGKVSSLNSS